MPKIRWFRLMGLAILGAASLAAQLRSGAGSTPTTDFVLGAPTGGIRPLLGLNGPTLPSGEPGNPDMTSSYRQLGVTFLRTHDYYGPMDMSTIYPDTSRDPSDPASYDFEASDRYFRALLDGGFEPYLRVGNSYNAHPPYPPPDRCPADLSNWAAAAVEVVRHYSDGAVWGSDRLRCVEIWNEPDNTQFWDCDRARFFDLFARTARALKSAFPGLEVGGPGLTPAGCLSPQGRAYTGAFLDHAAAQSVPLDFFSWHLYSNDPEEFAEACAFYREQLDLRGFTSAAQHVTEWNTQVSGETPPSEALALRAGGKGASILTAAWIAMQEGGVEEAALYRGADPAPDVPTFYGLFYADGQPKKAALTFSLWRSLAAHPERLALAPSRTPVLWALAGRDARGEVALLVANPSEAQASWRFAFADGRPAGRRYRASVQEVGDGGEGVKVFSPGGSAVPIGAHAVQLLTLSPWTVWYAEPDAAPPSP